MVAAGTEGNIRTPESYDFFLPNQIEFYPEALPAATAIVTDGVRFDLVLAPEEDTATIDADFLNRWQKVIRAGAMGYLYAMEGKPWFSEAGVKRTSRDFIRGIAKARRESYNSHTSRQLTMRAADFLGRGSQANFGRYEALFGSFWRR